MSADVGRDRRRMSDTQCRDDAHLFLGLHDTCRCGEFTLPPTEEEEPIMATSATAQLLDQHRELAALKARALQLAEAMQQRDRALAIALDVVTAALARRGFLGESERWALAAKLTAARLLLEPDHITHRGA